MEEIKNPMHKAILCNLNNFLKSTEQQIDIQAYQFELSLKGKRDNLITYIFTSDGFTSEH